MQHFHMTTCVAKLASGPHGFRFFNHLLLPHLVAFNLLSTLFISLLLLPHSKFGTGLHNGFQGSHVTGKFSYTIIHSLALLENVNRPNCFV